MSHGGGKQTGCDRAEVSVAGIEKRIDRCSLNPKMLLLNLAKESKH
jgi:hypothetical protein